MKDLLERVLKQLPGYLPDLVSLVTGPKTAILRWIEETKGDLARPLIFVAVSVAIGFLLQLPQLVERMRTFEAAAPGLALAYSLLICAQIIVLLGWSIACWGALRHLHGVARWRSTLAGIATLAAAVVFFPGMNYVLLGMFGTHAPPLR